MTEFLGFSFCLYIAGAGNPAILTGAEEARPNKILLSVAKGPRKVQLSKTENIYITAAVLCQVAGR